MTRSRRSLILTTASSLLLVAVAALWVRSYSVRDALRLTRVWQDEGMDWHEEFAVLSSHGSIAYDASIKPAHTFYAERRHPWMFEREAEGRPSRLSVFTQLATEYCVMVPGFETARWHQESTGNGNGQPVRRVAYDGRMVVIDYWLLALVFAVLPVRAAVRWIRRRGRSARAKPGNGFTPLVPAGAGIRSDGLDPGAS